MSFKDKWKEINNFSLADKLLPGYVINKNIFRFALLICVLLLFAVLSNYGFDFSKEFVYVECPSDSPGNCINPFYQENSLMASSCSDPVLCSTLYLIPGETYGEKPPSIVSNFHIILLSVFGTAVLFNHFKYNKGYKRK